MILLIRYDEKVSVRKYNNRYENGKQRKEKIRKAGGVRKKFNIDKT